MDKYEVIGLLGEGSFGRVYKAKQVSNGEFVALKVISKRGRSQKELKGFRRECEIQRELHHPNIIQMLDSFETENEIVVITEFAHKELNFILGKEGILSEEKVQPIVYDLVSALYYLHSNRVLHRDLKPQNILLDLKNSAKLCDFGFARNMSTGTHVLTSIKGTPLYMAPELIEEQPYDYNADLWSLGCIIYELLMGSPPFCTTSILHLIRLIRHKQIEWPTFLSDNCTSFLKGLLHKNPTNRLTWDSILNHPFVKGHILLCKKTAIKPLTRPLSANTMQVKEQQKKDHFNQRKNKAGDSIKNAETDEATSLSNTSINFKRSDSEDLKNNNSTVSVEYITESEENIKVEMPETIASIRNISPHNPKVLGLRGKLSFIENNQPIENEEWIVFLHRSIQEVMNGELSSLMQINQANILLAPLRNSNANSKVLLFVCRLFSLPLVICENSNVFDQIKKVYLEVKLIPNLIYASKLLLRQHSGDPSLSNSSSRSSLTSVIANEVYKKVEDLDEDDLQAIESIYLLILHLVYIDDNFLLQLCDALVVLNVYNLFKMLLFLVKIRVHIVLHVVAILTHIIRKFPENHELVENILMNDLNMIDDNLCHICFTDFLRHVDPRLRERTCYFLLFSGKCLQANAIKYFWNDNVKETLEALMFDSIDSVRNAADATVEELKQKSFYKYTSINS